MSARGLRSPLIFKLFAASALLGAYGCPDSGPADKTPPVISASTPADGATAVEPGAAITATFSESMNPATLNADTFKLSGVTGAVTYDAATRRATFTPPAALAAQTAFTATVTTGATDLAGNALTQDVTWRFTTRAAPDTTPPAITATSPANGATAVDPATNITATFSEAMTAATLTTATFTVSGVSGAVTVDAANRLATFTPTAPLAAQTAYTATVTTGVKDLAGNALAANVTWTFTTRAAPDTTPPTITATSPANAATAVDPATVITATFSEAMTASTITASTFTVGGVTGAVTCDALNRRATFTPSAPLAFQTTYNATVTTGAKDLAGNGLAANVTWSFTTRPPPDTTPPTVTLTTPPDTATDIQATSAITASFSEAMTASTLTTATFTLSGGVTGAVTYDAPNLRATFTPAAPLAPLTAYTATITTGAKDLAGNGLAAPYAWTFTTAAPHLGAVFLPKTGQVLCYGTGASAVVQNCTGTAQDGELRKGVAWPVPRFTDNLDGTITDHLTALQWLQDADCLNTNYPTYDVATLGGGNGRAAWASALSFVAGLNDGTYPLCAAGLTGWRLPNINELASLGGTGRDQSLDLMNPPIGFTHVKPDNYYWSSTTGMWPYMFGNDPPYYAWGLNFFGSIPEVVQKDAPFYVWPVRDAGSAATAPLPATGQTASFAAGDDGGLRKGVAWPATRFVASASGSGTVMTDMLTGLIWPQDTYAPGPADCNPAALKTWAQAFTYIACLNADAYLGRTDWRLPNKTEFRSLYAFAEIYNDQWLAAQGFTNVPSSTDPSFYYWTSTTNESTAGYAWSISIVVGRDDDTSFDKATQFRVWPVAGG